MRTKQWILLSSIVRQRGVHPEGNALRTIETRYQNYAQYLCNSILLAIIKVDPPRGWSFDPTEVLLNVDGTTDACSQGKDINFIFKGFGITGKVNYLLQRTFNRSIDKTEILSVGR